MDAAFHLSRKLAVPSEDAPEVTSGNTGGPVRPVPHARLSAATIIIAYLFCASGSLHGQTGCDNRWNSCFHWRGSFQVFSHGSGPNSAGTVITANDSLAASFDRNYLLGTTTFTNDLGTISESLAASCAPAPGQAIEQHVGSGPLTNSQIDVFVNSAACTYLLELTDYVMGDDTFDQCGISTVDLGMGPMSPSLGSLQINPKLDKLPLPTFGQYLTGMVSTTYLLDGVPMTVDFQWKITPLDLLITNVQTPAIAASRHTFVSTDPITLTAVVVPAVAGKRVEWTVTGLNAAAGVSGLPQKQVVATDANGVSTFVFTPNASASFVADRKSRWTGGSTAANLPVGFEVVAALPDDGLSSVLSSRHLGPLEQDEIDTLRQEYLDILQPVPTRAQVLPSLGSPWNKGNYNVQRDNNLQSHFNAILASYRGSTVTNAGTVVTIPADAVLVVNSAFRCPQLNKSKVVGSVHPESLHTRGSALDLKPLPVIVNVGGKAVSLDLHGTLYPALARAVSAQGFFMLPERSAVPVPLGDPTENHIHTQW